jgi:hypothetical protein
VILPAHDYHNRECDAVDLLPGLVLFKLVIPPLQPGVVGPFNKMNKKLDRYRAHERETFRIGRKYETISNPYR